MKDQGNLMRRTFKKNLIANRGETVIRIMRAANELGKKIGGGLRVMRRWMRSLAGRGSNALA